MSKAKVTFRRIGSIPNHYYVTVAGREEPSAIAVKDLPRKGDWSLHEHESGGRKGALINYFKSKTAIERYLLAD